MIEISTDQMTIGNNEAARIGSDVKRVIPLTEFPEERLGRCRRTRFRRCTTPAAEFAGIQIRSPPSPSRKRLRTADYSSGDRDVNCFGRFFYYLLQKARK